MVILKYHWKLAGGGNKDAPRRPAPPTGRIPLDASRTEPRQRGNMIYRRTCSMAHVLRPKTCSDQFLTHKAYSSPWHIIDHVILYLRMQHLNPSASSLRCEISVGLYFELMIDVWMISIRVSERTLEGEDGNRGWEGTGRVNKTKQIGKANRPNRTSMLCLKKLYPI